MRTSSSGAHVSAKCAAVEGSSASNSTRRSGPRRRSAATSRANVGAAAHGAARRCSGGPEKNLAADAARRRRSTTPCGTARGSTKGTDERKTHRGSSWQRAHACQRTTTRVWAVRGACARAVSVGCVSAAAEGASARRWTARRATTEDAAPLPRGAPARQRCDAAAARPSAAPPGAHAREVACIMGAAEREAGGRMCWRCRVGASVDASSLLHAHEKHSRCQLSGAWRHFAAAAARRPRARCVGAECCDADAAVSRGCCSRLQAVAFSPPPLESLARLASGARDLAPSGAGRSLPLLRRYVAERRKRSRSLFVPQPYSASSRR
jgi:hypothetical protein